MFWLSFWFYLYRGKADSPKPTGTERGQGAPTGLQALELTEEQRARYSREANGTQKVILDDGLITFDEYEAAIFAAIRCYRDADVEISAYPTRNNTPPGPGPTLTARGEYQYLANFREGTTADEANKIIVKCERDIVGIIRPLWLDHVSPDEREVQQSRDEMAICLKSAGFDVPEHPSQEDLFVVAFPPSGQPPAGRIVLPPEYEQCAAPARQKLGLPSFIG